jgi:hypothetical protein
MGWLLLLGSFGTVSPTVRSVVVSLRPSLCTDNQISHMIAVSHPLVRLIHSVSLLLLYIQVAEVVYVAFPQSETN